LNGDGSVNGADFAIFTSNFGKSLPAPPPAVTFIATAPPAAAQSAAAPPAAAAASAAQPSAGAASAKGVAPARRRAPAKLARLSRPAAMR
jgi:hypothetical protein